ncbi:DciA family protein [Streptomyces sp. MNU76]|uniref:DciA family protein n=1 Tax=Streptomyces sp. MNU76 TaxID=2560026 RepID=UPI001E5A40DB|nr:DciA family protein [Streptomyces sp. MNU76]MCC9707293.1 DciA family protein [Streptomyces sp. MNU76]
MSSELSGIDLARQALTAAREAAKKNGGTRKEKPKRRTGTVVRRDGRDPLGLGAAIGMMMTERGMVAPAAGGSVLAQFDDILAAAVPELAGHVQAVGFDADTGRLDVVPEAPAYGTKLRWSAPKMIEATNATVPGANVRILNVLSPASGKASPATAAADPDPRPPVPAGLVHTRETASDGYHQALAASQAARPERHVDPAIAEAIEAQTRALRELSRRAFPDPDPDSIENTRAKRRREAKATHAQALRRARAERAQRVSTAAGEQTLSDRRTA